MKTNLVLFALGTVLSLSKVGGAFEATDPIQTNNISILMEKSAYISDQIGNYNLTEIYIAGALLSEGWGCSKDEKRAVQLYLSALDELRKNPMDMDVVWDKEIDLKEFSHNSDSKFFNIFKQEIEQQRKPFVLYAMISDTIRMLLQQGQYETALKLIEESRLLTFLKGKGLKKKEIDVEDRGGRAAENAIQVIHFYETMINDDLEEGYLFLDVLFPRKTKNGDSESQASHALLRNQIIGELVVRGYDQKSEEEKLKAFPYVLRNAKLGIPQAMIAMHLYYKYGCGFLPSNKHKAESWLKKANDMKNSCFIPPLD